MTEHSSAPSDHTTLSTVLAEFESAGFGGDFEIPDGASIRCLTCDEQSEASEFREVNRRRLEGASDPDDMISVVAVTCPRCGTGGTLVLKYGPTAPENEAAVGQQLRAQSR